MKSEIRNSRGYRNNNPMNVRKSPDLFKGELRPSLDKQFKQFKRVEYGYRCAFVILRTYMEKYGLQTIRKMITRYAPPADNNDTEAYIRTVSSYTGIPSDEDIPFTPERMIPIVAAMSYVENGIEADKDEVTAGWELL